MLIHVKEWMKIFQLQVVYFKIPFLALFVNSGFRWDKKTYLGKSVMVHVVHNISLNESGYKVNAKLDMHVRIKRV